MIAMAIAVVLLTLALAFLVYRHVLLVARVKMLEYQQGQQIEADAKVAAALSEAVALRQKVDALEATVHSASGEVAKIAVKQAELDGDVELRQERKKKVRTVKLNMSRGW